MKRFIFVLSVFFVCCIGKSQDQITDYIYSEDGFEVKEGVITDVDFYGEIVTFHCTGLYTKDGRSLVSVIDSYYVKSDGSKKTDNHFFVIEGTEVICSNAFLYATSRSRMCAYLPSSVKYLAPDNDGYIMGICDGCHPVSNSNNVIKKTPEISEVAKYDIHGIKITEEVSGVNIIKMSDGSAKKIIVK